VSDQHETPVGVPTCYRHPDREAYITCQRCGRTICPECMNDAAVGFQCPHCVAEGAKQTRAGRTTYGGLRPTNASITSLVLITVNAAVWLAIFITGGSSSRLVDLLALRPSGLCEVTGGYIASSGLGCPGGGGLPGVADGAYWQVLTSGFTHVAIIHIAFNMFALYSIGPQLEAALGRTRFLALYLLSLLAGSVAVMWVAPEYQATLGASGAIYGLFAALIVIVHKVGGDLRQLFVLVGINLLITFAIPGISWQAHIGGFVGGAAITAILVYSPQGPRRTRVQALGLVAVGLALVAALLARIAILA
jgi:membrane associated rhomboid family serine protease